MTEMTFCRVAHHTQGFTLAYLYVSTADFLVTAAYRQNGAYLLGFFVMGSLTYVIRRWSYPIFLDSGARIERLKAERGA